MEFIESKKWIKDKMFSADTQQAKVLKTRGNHKIDKRKIERKKGQRNESNTLQCRHHYHFGSMEYREMIRSLLSKPSQL